MPFLYAALPITLAVVGSLAITVVFLEVIVPALLDDHDERNALNDDRRRRERRRRQLVGVTRLGDGGDEARARARSSARENENETNESLRRRTRRRRKVSSHISSTGQSEFAGHETGDDDDDDDRKRYILGDVTASEHELENRSLSRDGDRPPTYQLTADSSGSRSAKALLLFEASDTTQNPFDAVTETDQDSPGSYAAKPLISLADTSETFRSSAAADTATTRSATPASSSTQAISSGVNSPFATPPLLVNSLASSPVLVPLPLPSSCDADPKDDGWTDTTTIASHSSSLVASPVLISTSTSTSTSDESSPSLATLSFITAPSSSAAISSPASVGARGMSRTVSQTSSVSVIARSEAMGDDDREEESWTRLSDEEEWEGENVWAEAGRAVPARARTAHAAAS